MGAKKSSELLEERRRQIEALDRQILGLVGDRLALAEEIGALKRELGMPLRNFEVEAAVLDRFAVEAARLGLPGDVGSDLAAFLIGKAVEKQGVGMVSAYSGDAFVVLVVGGKGGMGAWTARFLGGQGHRVKVLDPSGAKTDFDETDDLVESAKESDVVFLAVPMDVCPGLIEELADTGARAVVVEMCSLKGHLREAVARAREGGLKVVSIHPMFGPGTRTLNGKTVVICDDAGEEEVAVVERLLADTSAGIVRMGVDDHDERMGLVLGMTHLVNLAFARALEKSGLTSEQLGEVAGVTYAKQVKTTAEVVGENPDLYYEIQALGGSAERSADWLREALDEYLGAVMDAAPARFAEIMTSSRRFLRGG